MHFGQISDKNFGHFCSKHNFSSNLKIQKFVKSEHKICCKFETQLEYILELFSLCMLTLNKKTFFTPLIV